MYQKRLVDEITARKDGEQMNEARLDSLRKAIEIKQREIESLSQKMVLPIDQDILRMRISKDLENKYRFEIEQAKIELEKAQEA